MSDSGPALAEVADGLNEVILANEALGAELARVSDVVGKEGKPPLPAPAPNFAGTKVLVVDDDFRNIFAMPVDVAELIAALQPWLSTPAAAR